MSRIHVTIDRVALAGFEPAERAALVEGLKSELSRMLADPATRSAWARSRRTPVVRLGRMPLTRGSAGGRSFGNGLARAIGKKMKP
jgi:hypothetical protein